MSTSKAPTYERRIVLFIDFLGFKEVIEETNDNPEALRHLIAALNEIGEIDEGSVIKSRRVTQFSDSVVVSYKIGEPSGVFWMLNAIGITVISLAWRGYLIRGAVTIGDLYHNERHVVGPAMVSAYQMESEFARFPRVIVDPAILNEARRSRSEYHSPAEEERYVRHFLTKDSDGRLYFDWISWKPVVEVVGADNSSYPNYLERLSRMIRKGLKHADYRVAEKYLWVHRHYRAALKEFAALPPDHGYWRENPSHREKVGALPHLKKRAFRASRRVARGKKD